MKSAGKHFDQLWSTFDSLASARGVALGVRSKICVRKCRKVGPDARDEYRSWTIGDRGATHHSTVSAHYIMMVKPFKLRLLRQVLPQRGGGVSQMWKGPSRLLKRRYMAYEISHSLLLIDITSIGLADEIFPPEGKAQDLLSLRFQEWSAAEKFLLGSGASRDSVDKARSSIDKCGFGIINISS